MWINHDGVPAEEVIRTRTIRMLNLRLPVRTMARKLWHWFWYEYHVWKWAAAECNLTWPTHRWKSRIAHHKRRMDYHYRARYPELWGNG